MKVLGWWLLMHLVRAARWVLVWVLYVPMALLAALLEGGSEAEMAWLRACSERRLARRRRLNFRGVGHGK